MKKNQHVVYEESLFVEVMIFYKTVTKYLNKEFPNEDSLGIYEIFFLIFLESNPEGTTYYELTKKFPFDQSYINKVIKKLEEKGLVHKTKDGKKKMITLSDKSYDVLSARPTIRDNFIELLDKNNITDEELTEFIRLLKKLVEVMKEK